MGKHCSNCKYCDQRKDHTLCHFHKDIICAPRIEAMFCEGYTLKQKKDRV